ncbi:MAG: hypothetical protein IT376_00745 [Polyangiaceae bacterium]|nr:hypothetical protein [Polyangiaceae bacterium]
MRRWAVVVLALLVALLVVAPAGAAPRLEVQPAGVVTLTPRPGGRELTAEITLANNGDSALRVDEVTLRAGTRHAPLPPLGLTLAVRAEDGFFLQPGERRAVTLRWARAPGDRSLFVQGHVLVRAGGQPERAIGFVGHAEGAAAAPVRHLPSLLLLAPLLAALVALVAGPRLMRARRLRWAPIGAGAAQLLLLGGAYSRLDPTAGRLDGSDGVHVLERLAVAPGAGVELLLAVDSLSLAPLVALAALLVAAASIALQPAARPERAWPLVLALHAAATASLLAADVVTLALAGGCAVGAAVTLAWTSGGAALGRRWAWLGGAAIALLGVGLVAAVRGGGGGYLADGTWVDRVLALGELARAGAATGSEAWLGLRVGKVAWVCGCGGWVLLAGAPLLHGLHVRTAERLPPALGLALLGTLALAGGHGAVRLGLGVLPEATAWAAPGLRWAAAVAALTLAGLVLLERRLGGVWVTASVARRAVVGVGVAALVPMSAEGAMGLVVFDALALALGFAATAALADRTGTTVVESLAGLARDRPRLTVLLGVALAVSAAAPATPPFLGSALVVAGAYARAPLVAVLVALALATLAVAHVAVARRLLFGEVAPGWRADLRLAPTAGRLSASTEREDTLWSTLGLAALILGVASWGVLRSLDTAAIDLVSPVDPPGPAQLSLGPAEPARVATRAGGAPGGRL